MQGEEMWLASCPSHFIPGKEHWYLLNRHEKVKCNFHIQHITLPIPTENTTWKLGYPLVFHIHLIKKIKQQWKNLLPYIQVWHCTANCNNAILLKIVKFYMCTIKPAKNFVSGILTMEKGIPYVEVKSVCLLPTMEPFNTPPHQQIRHWRLSPRFFGQLSSSNCTDP